MNTKALVEDLLETFDKINTERYFQAAPPQQPQQGGIPGMGSLPNPANAQGNGGGVTNPALAAGPLSPSNDASVNPAGMMQQFLASQGGGRAA